MKPGLALAIVGALVAASALAYAASSSGKSTAFSGALRPPMKRGQVVMITYSLPHGMTALQGAALMSFVLQWGTPLGAPQASAMLDGTQTLSVVARVDVDQPKGPPEIPSQLGNLVPLTWQETASQVAA